MAKYLLLAVGKRHDAVLATAIQDYTDRLQRYVSVEWRFVPSPKADFSIAEQQKRETTALLEQLKPDDQVILLDETGQQFDSPTLAQPLERPSAGRLVFVIGGAYGVDERLRQRAHLVWSLSKLVFPHQMVRLILAEQLYRAQTILHGEKYHHQ